MRILHEENRVEFGSTMVLYVDLTQYVLRPTPDPETGLVRKFHDSRRRRLGVVGVSGGTGVDLFVGVRVPIVGGGRVLSPTVGVELSGAVEVACSGIVGCSQQGVGGRTGPLGLSTLLSGG